MNAELGDLVNPVSQNLSMASGVPPHWTLYYLATCGTAMARKNKNIIQKTQMSSSYSWRPKMEESGVMRNSVFLGLRKVK
jgi:hypothetical protein